MSRSRRGGGRHPVPPPPDPRIARNFQLGLGLVRGDHALGALDVHFCRSSCRVAPKDGWAMAESDGCVHVNPLRLAEPREWAWVLAHCLLHLGFGHLPAARGPRVQPDRFDVAARCVVVNRFQQSFPLGTAPFELPASFPGGDEEQLAARFRRDGIPEAYSRCGAGGSEPDQRLEPWPYELDPEDWREVFARALTRRLSASMAAASSNGDGTAKGPWTRALDWFVAPTRCSAASRPG